MSTSGISTWQAGHSSISPVAAWSIPWRAAFKPADKFCASADTSGGKPGSNPWTTIRNTKGTSAADEI